MRSNTSTLLRAGVITPVALAAALAFAGTANAAVSVAWTCKGTLGPFSQISNMTTSVTGTAPASVTMTTPPTPPPAVAITIAPGSSTVPSTAAGVTVNNINTMKMLIPVPANSSYVSASTSGGTVSGSATLVGSNVVLTIPGPITGGSSFTPPAVTINVTANAVGSITSKYAGTSYTDPGMTFTTNTSIGNVATACFASPNPTLTTTTVT